MCHASRTPPHKQASPAICLCGLDLIQVLRYELFCIHQELTSQDDEICIYQQDRLPC